MNQEDLLADIRPWLKAVAYRLSSGQESLRQDLAQEGWIAAWRTLGKPHPHPSALARTAARNRMIRVLTNRTSFGSERPVGVNTGKAQLVPLEDHNPVVSSALDEVVQAYHNHEVSQALQRLPFELREMVEAIFWDRTQTVREPEWPSVRAHLRKALGHLQ